MAKVYRRPAARRDLVVNYVYLSENAGVAVANRFLQQVQASFDDLAAEPLIGAPVVACNPVLADLDLSASAAGRGRGDTAGG